MIDFFQDLFDFATQPINCTWLKNNLIAIIRQLRNNWG